MFALRSAVGLRLNLRWNSSTTEIASNLAATRVREERKEQLFKRLIHVRRLSLMTPRGKLRRTYALVIVGDQKGRAGFGEGKSTDAAKAIEKAALRAERSMFSIERYENRTVFSDMDHMYCATRLKICSGRAGQGIVANENVHEVCRCFGIKDISVKILGSVNPMNVVKGMFSALKNMRTPKEIAEMRGMRLTDVVSNHYGKGPQVSRMRMNKRQQLKRQLPQTTRSAPASDSPSSA